MMTHAENTNNKQFVAIICNTQQNIKRLKQQRDLPPTEELQSSPDDENDEETGSSEDEHEEKSPKEEKEEAGAGQEEKKELKKLSREGSKQHSETGSTPKLSLDSLFNVPNDEKEPKEKEKEKEK